jgi:hypothetical protein
MRVPDPDHGNRGDQTLGRGVGEQVADHAHGHRHARRRKTLLTQISRKARQGTARDLIERDPPEARADMAAILLGTTAELSRSLQQTGRG